MSESRRLWAVVPIKGFARPKQRLASVLTPDERRALAEVMLDDVMAALAAASGLAGIVIVSGDDRVGGIARRAGARWLGERPAAGQSGAVRLAAAALVREGAEGMIAIPADVPLASARDIEAILAAHGRAPAATLVPALGEGGTNALAASPPDALALHFGHDSFAAHRRAARDAGIEPLVLSLPGLALDIDRPGDLANFLARPRSTRTHAFLLDSGIAGRLAAT